MSRCLATYRSKFDSREPNLARQEFEDETRDYRGHEEVLEFPPPPADTVELGRPPRGAGDYGEYKYLWVVLDGSVPIAQETGALGRTTQRGRLSHTNLTGGMNAFCGGEVFFRSPSQIWVNGGSSRYKPRSKEEYYSIIDAFGRAGYVVDPAEYDEESGEARNFLPTEMDWDIDEE